MHFLSDNKIWLIRRNGECSIVKLEVNNKKIDLNWSS